MDQAIVFVLRHTNAWKVAVGDQRFGTYPTAEDAVWGGIGLALHLRREGVSVELRIHDETGIRKIWPPALPKAEPVLDVKAPRQALSTNS